ncbi:DEKNAAC103482 [Brettanomyces naardenensis]|uniref:Diphthine--ammonia ligase n=1 Tax=Brettanomyces naardenensis TaxID=13370 RepID=A0A448YNL3_BRENA|nr:DEKNAAC103482 [Brettanomyces naardenensis]
MYQTVGYDALNSLAECIGKPLYTQMIKGTAANQKLEYAKTNNDETEDLYQLLSHVLENHPDVEAVSVGAILSNYQRTRVEDVCNRLGLTSLAYLWQRDQIELMSEMCTSGLEAVLIKVAAIGLNESNLGMTLQQAYPVLLNLNSRFGVHVCGEGGEFETLVLDAPFFRFGRLIIEEEKIIRHTNDEVWYLKLRVRVEKKDPPLPESQDWSKFINQPSLLREQFEDIRRSVDGVVESGHSKVQKTDTITWKTNAFHIGSKVYVSNLYSTKSTIVEQITEIFDQLKVYLRQYHVTFANVQSVDLFINDMADFAEINSIYKGYFTEPLPPARCCVESNLPASTKAILSVKIIPQITLKQGLHVQSRSYWAPSNIGPYSQTIMDRQENIAHLSGQIPLIPKDMQLCNQPASLSACLALQHLDNVKQVTGYTEDLLSVAFMTDKSWLDVVVEVHRQYIDNSNFLIVLVTDLPKGAPVEWSGLSYKDVEEEEDEEYEEATKSPLERVSVRFTNSLENFHFSKRSHYTIYSNDVIDVPATISYQYSPVSAVHRGDEVEFKYGVVEER